MNGRFLITLTVIVALLVCSRIYTAILLPMTAVTSEPTGVEPTAEEASIRKPALFEQQALDIFPDAPWTRNAEHTFQLAESVTLYFREWRRVETTGNTIQISPVAILWKDPKREGVAPYRLLAERAQIKFQNTFFDSAISLTDAKPGRIVWASLEGAVHIDGPDGLRIEGQNFKFEEESRQLYSDFPIQFAFGPTPQDQRRIQGSSHQIQVTFLPSNDPLLGKDMPRIGGLAQVLLRRNVSLDSTFQQKGEPRRLRLTSLGSLEYDVVNGECTIDDQVRVVHQSSKGEQSLEDSMECEWLRLMFNRVIASENGNEPVELSTSPRDSFDGLTLKSIQAKGSLLGQGKRLTIASDDQQVNGTMQDLFYDAAERRALLVDKEQVTLIRGDALFRSPVIDFRHTPENELERLDCRGAGDLEFRQSGMGAEPLCARWQGGLEVLYDAASKSHQIRLDDQVQVGVPNQFQLNADHFSLWVNLDRVQNQQPSGNGLSRPLPLKRLRAEGHVTFGSEMLIVSRTNLIDAVISPGIIEPIHAPQRPPKQASNSTGNDKPERERSPWVVEADQLSLDLVHDSMAAAVDFRRIIGSGQVVVQYAMPESDHSTVRGPLVLTGQELTAENAGGIRQVLKISSPVQSDMQDPAQAVASFGDARIWGKEITLSRHENQVKIPGAGGLTASLPRKPENGVPATGSKLEIVWSEGMNFDGLAMRFWGKITASMPGEQDNISRLVCEDLTAILNQRISFVDPESRPVEPAIESLIGKHHVVLEAFERGLSGEVTAIRSASVASFELHQSTGQFKAQGPGQIHSWSQGDQLKFAPGEQPQANQPANPAQTRWRYAGVAFAGTMDGNWNRNEATLKDRVQIISAPVEKARIKFRREQLSENTPEAENAVWMKCHQLRIVRKLKEDQKTAFMEVYATGSTELEGHVFHAYADELTFDEWSGQFVLRGLGRDATLYHQPLIGRPSNTSAAQVLKFNPSKRDFRVGGSSGLSGSFQ